MKENTRLQQILLMLQDEPGDSFLRFAAALEYEKMNEPETALRYYEMIVHDEPDYSGVYLHLGNLYARMNEQAKAKEIYERGMLLTRGKDNKTYQELRSAMEELEW
jgi:tetratricopeptide (TPR) repeat protein